MDSILNTIKKMIGGIPADDNSFDTDIIVHVNTALATLRQLGVVGDEAFIEDDTTTWSDIFSDTTKFSMVKTYVYLKVKLLFDPPQNSTTVSSITEQIKELEWRLNVAAEQESNPE
jgi:hypothetical protein